MTPIDERELAELEQLCTRDPQSASHLYTAAYFMRRMGGGARGQMVGSDGSLQRAAAEAIEDAAVLTLRLIAAYREATAEIARLRGEVEEYRAAERFEQERNP